MNVCMYVYIYTYLYIWKRWRELASLLVNQSIPLGNRAQVYRACVRSLLLYGSETWATTKQLEALLIRCDVRMLRYLMGIRWQDEVSNEVVRRSGLEGLEEVLHKIRLRRFGHVRRREEHILRQAVGFEVEGKRPPGRPRKTWRKVVEEDMRMMNITGEMALDRQQWRRLISHPTPP